MDGIDWSIYHVSTFKIITMPSIRDNVGSSRNGNRNIPMLWVIINNIKLVINTNGKVWTTKSRNDGKATTCVIWAASKTIDNVKAKGLIAYYATKKYYKHSH